MKPMHMQNAAPQTAETPPADTQPTTVSRAAAKPVSGAKPKIWRTVKLLLLLVAVTLTAGVLQEYVLCHADHNRQRLKGFYLEEPDSLDIVFMGASEVYSDFAPGYAYDKFHLTSYLFSTQSNSILNYKAQLKNILSRQNPDLIVIELNGALYKDDGETTKEANLHNYADNVPLDGVKMEWIAGNGGSDWQEYAFPLLKYHGVWKDFPNDMLYQKTVWEDKQRGYSYLKGILNEAAIFQPTQRSMNDMLKQSAGSKKPLGEQEEAELRDLLQFCCDEGLDNVVFARFPHIVVRRTFSRFERSNTVADIVAEYGFDYLNFELNYDDTGLNEATDFYNLDHLNIYGQTKFTEFFVNYLQSHYNITPRAQEEFNQITWENAAAYYNAYYRYSNELIQSGTGRELSEDSELIETLEAYL